MHLLIIFNVLKFLFFFSIETLENPKQGLWVSLQCWLTYFLYHVELEVELEAGLDLDEVFWQEYLKIKLCILHCLILEGK